MIFQTSMIMFHVNLQGCNWWCLRKILLVSKGAFWEAFLCSFLGKNCGTYKPSRERTYVLLKCLGSSLYNTSFKYVFHMLNICCVFDVLFHVVSIFYCFFWYLQNEPKIWRPQTWGPSITWISWIPRIYICDILTLFFCSPNRQVTHCASPIEHWKGGCLPVPTLAVNRRSLGYPDAKKRTPVISRVKFHPRQLPYW